MIGHLLILAYLIGSISFGLILTKLLTNIDLKEIGSGNIGATNVLRTGNKWLAFATLLLDGGKGAFVILILYNAPKVVPLVDPWVQSSFALTHPEHQFSEALLIGLCAILGHCFPVWLKFKGGKGVATALGVLLAAVPWAGFVALTTWGIVAGFFRYSSLAALSALAIAPLATLLIYGSAPAVYCGVITLLVFWRHKDNVKRLMKGEEPKIGQKQS